jgi:hypothetical protein
MSGTIATSTGVKKAPKPVGAPKSHAAEPGFEWNTAHTAASVLNELDAARSRILQPLQHANERCIEMLVQAARGDRKGTFPLVAQLREVLSQLTPEIRARAARKAYLLVDFQFGNDAWWQALKVSPTRPAPLTPARGSFPRASAVQLGRATLMLAWHSVRADVNASCLLGISPGVAATLATFSLTELDRIVERRFRHVRPRWEDRPMVWRQLLVTATNADTRQTRDLNLRALQLITGDLIAARLDAH